MHFHFSYCTSPSVLLHTHRLSPGEWVGVSSRQPNLIIRTQMENGRSSSSIIRSLLTISPSFTSSRLLHTIPPSYIILLNQPTVFLAQLAQYRPSTVCQELAAAIASSAGSNLARSLAWHGSSVQTK